MGFSEKQREILRFHTSAMMRSSVTARCGRGKTSVMSLSLLPVGNGTFQRLRVCTLWEVGRGGGAQHCDAASGVQYLRQNFTISYSRSGHVITARRGVRENRFYLFGGKDESSYTLIQGITLAGVLLDEVALMPPALLWNRPWPGAP